MAVLTENKENEGILSRISSTISQSQIVDNGKRAASDAGFVAKKLLKSTGKAAWIFGTTMLILVFPLVLIEQEQHYNELEMQQATLLGIPAVSPLK